MRRFSLYFLLILVLTIAITAEARITNTQDTLFSIHEDGLYLNSDLAMSRTTGTAEVMVFSGDLGSQWLTEPHLFFSSASGKFAEKDDERFISQYFGHLRYRFRIWQMFMAEVFAQVEYNEFRRILTRMPLGAGPRIEHAWGEGRQFQLAFGTSYMFELIHLSEDRDEEDVRYEDSLAYEYNHRWNNYLAFKLSPSFVSIGATIYVQPLFKDFSNYLLLIESDISFKITDELSIAISYTLSHDSRPPEGVVKRDTALKTVFKMSFGPWFSDPVEAKNEPTESTPSSD